MIGAWLLVSLGICGLVLLIGWSRRPFFVAAALTTPDPGPSAIPEADGISQDLDVEGEVRAAVARAAAVASRNLTRVEIAVQSGLAVRFSPTAVRAALDGLVTSALGDPSCGWVLLSAARQAGWVRIAISDDAVATATTVREATLRHVGSLVAMQGGSMQIDVRPGEGTTVALRLPVPLAPVIHRTGSNHEDRSDAREPPPEPAVRPQSVQTGDLQRQL